MSSSGIASGTSLYCITYAEVNKGVEREANEERGPRRLADQALGPRASTGMESIVNVVERTEDTSQEGEITALSRHIEPLDKAERTYAFVCGTPKSAVCYSKEYCDLLRRKIESTDRRRGVHAWFVFGGVSYSKGQQLGTNYLARILQDRDKKYPPYQTLQVLALPGTDNPPLHFAFSDDRWACIGAPHFERDRYRSYVFLRNWVLVTLLRRRMVEHVRTAQQLFTESDYTGLKDLDPMEETPLPERTLGFEPSEDKRNSRELSTDFLDRALHALLSRDFISLVRQLGERSMPGAGRVDALSQYYPDHKSEIAELCSAAPKGKSPFCIAGPSAETGFLISSLAWRRIQKLAQSCPYRGTRQV